MARPGASLALLAYTVLATSAHAVALAQEPTPPADGSPFLSPPPAPPSDPVPPPPIATASAAVTIPVPVAPSPGLVGPDLYYEPDAERRLGGWLLRHDERARFGRIALGIVNIALGALLGATSIGAVSDADDEWVANWLGIQGVLLSAFMIGSGVGVLNVTTPQEDRLARWQAARARGPIGAYEIGAFEGELFAEAEQARFGRTLGAVLGFSMAAGGGAAIGMGALMDLSEGDEQLTYLLGGLWFGTGLLVGVLSLVVETPIELEFENYRLGLGPLDSGGRPAVDTAP